MFHLIKSTGHIEFDCHNCILHGLAALYDLLYQDNVIYYLSIFHESPLIHKYEGGEKGFDPVIYDFGYAIICRVAKGDGTEVKEGGRWND
jgi:hypothetical protein